LLFVGFQIFLTEVHCHSRLSIMADDYSPPVTPLNDSTSVPVSRTRKRLAAAQRDSGNSELWSKEMSLERKESVLSVESEMSNHMTPSDKYSSKGRSVSIETPSGSKQQNQPLQNGSKPKTGGCPFAHGASADASETSPENSDMAYLYDQLRGLDTESNLDDNDDRSSMASGATHSSSLDAMSRFRQLQILLDRFAEGCLTPVVMIDSRGLIRSVNTETLNLFGYRRWEMIGRNVRFYVTAWKVFQTSSLFAQVRRLLTVAARRLNIG
jgi:PAS domain-containing protein